MRHGLSIIYTRTLVMRSADVYSLLRCSKRGFLCLFKEEDLADRLLDIHMFDGVGK